MTWDAEVPDEDWLMGVSGAYRLIADRVEGR